VSSALHQVLRRLSLSGNAGYSAPGIGAAQAVERRRSMVEAASPRSSIDERYISRWARLASSTGRPWSGRPLEQVAQIMAVSVERATAVAGQERYGCQLRRIHGVLGSWNLNGRGNSGHWCSSFW
jgi:hypothetical protein